MGIVSGSSNQVDHLSKLLAMSKIEQKESIDQVPVNDLIEIFISILKNKSIQEIDHLEVITIGRIRNLASSDNLNMDQINRIVSLYDNNEVNGFGETFIHKIFNKKNITNLFSYAINHHHESLLNEFIVRLSSIIEIQYKYFGGPICCFDIRIDKRLTRKYFPLLNILLNTLKGCLDLDKIHLNISDTLQFKFDELLTFIEGNRQLITCLYLQQKKISVEQFHQLLMLLNNCHNLKALRISNIKFDGPFFEFPQLTQLTHLAIALCTFTNPPDISSLKNLRFLYVSACKNFSTSFNLDGLPHLENVKYFHCDSLTSVQNLEVATNLKVFWFHNLASLRELPDLNAFPILEKITISNCDAITQEKREEAFTSLLDANPPTALKLSNQLGIDLLNEFEPLMAQVDLDTYLKNMDKFDPPNSPFRMTLLNTLIKSNPQKAVEHIDKFSTECIHTIEDKQAFIEAIKANCLQHDPTKALRLALEIDDLSLAENALQNGADVNVKIPGCSLLLNACKNRDARWVNLLLQYDADVEFIGGTHEHKTPLSVARLRGAILEECLALLNEKDDGFTQEVMEIKLLAHTFSIALETSVNGKVFNVEGFRPMNLVEKYRENSLFYDQLKSEILAGGGKIVDSLNVESFNKVIKYRFRRLKLIHAIDMTFSAIEHCLDHAGKDIYAEGGKLKDEFLENLRFGKPVICFDLINREGKWKTGGQNLHAWGLVVTKDQKSENYFIHRCNRGKSLSGIFVGKFNERQMLEIIHQYKHFANWKSTSKKDAIEFFDSLDSKIVNTKNYHITQTAQKVGNCCYSSLQSIELAVLIEQLKPICGEKISIDLAKEIKRKRTFQMQNNVLKAYLESHMPGKSKYTVNWDLLQAICKKPQKHDYHRLMIRDFLLRVKELDQYVEVVVDILLRVIRTESLNQ